VLPDKLTIELKPAYNLTTSKLINWLFKRLLPRLNNDIFTITAKNIIFTLPLPQNFLYTVTTIAITLRKESSFHILQLILRLLRRYRHGE
jgi:hypothetical protein